MTEDPTFTRTHFVADTSRAVDLHLVEAESLSDWTDMQTKRVRAFLETVGFQAQIGQIVLVPDADGQLTQVAVGRGTAQARARTRFVLGGARDKLPALTYRLHHHLGADDLAEETLGWCLGSYSYRRFQQAAAKPEAQMIAPAGVDAAQVAALASGEMLTRDLINTPASHMGPEELEAAFLALAQEHGADVSVIYGDDLLYQNLPLIHAVGRASERSPRLLDLRWGEAGPRLTLVGKGVCFDTGGLNLKPGSAMALMKKDMGGAATVMGLAHMIMAQRWPVQLRVVVPAVENAVSGNAMRPGDIVISRKGLSVEINNTDAEGRLVLADALALADEDAPDLMICMATLTGAARVALGPDVAPFFTRDAALAQSLMQASATLRDPLWQLPLHAPYETLIEPGIADLDNAPSGGMAGAITAALFLHRFVETCPRFAHFDIYGHQPSAAPARPKGGVGQGARALFGALPQVLGL